MDKVVDERERIPILPGDRIQSSVVLDEVELPPRKMSISVCSVRVIR
jgi:hypothetical protein